MKNPRPSRSVAPLVALALLAVAGIGDAVASPDPLVRFSGGIGSQPWAAANGAPVPNDVLGVNPGGRPWVIRKLSARIDADGSAVVRGKRLVFAGLGFVGTAGPVTAVVATLFCGGVASNSAPAALAPNGDFTITGVLSPMPASPCTSPVLLIRNSTAAGPGPWFAAGIPAAQDDDD